MLILGIDPGTATTGYGLIRIEDLKSGDKKIEVIDYGCLVTSREWAMGERLRKLYGELKDLLKLHNPDILAIEQIFFFSNAKTVISVGQARGIALLAAAENGTEIFEYSPLQIKLEFVGYGRAKKPEVEKKVKELLGVVALKKDASKKFSDGHHFDDAADALAVAICHFYKNGGQEYKLKHSSQPKTAKSTARKTNASVVKNKKNRKTEKKTDQKKILKQQKKKR